jgi:hypothetical protein
VTSRSRLCFHGGSPCAPSCIVCFNLRSQHPHETHNYHNCQCKRLPMVKWHQAISDLPLGLCFPNVVRLEPYYPKVTHIMGTLFDIFGHLLGQLKPLKSFMLQSSDANFASIQISPGCQHHFAHRVYQECCPTLEMAVIGPLMVWHLRDQPVHSPECHCDLELLSPRLIR